ncbi:hypothetical protein BT96DRAFT_961320 [Gymnopus androsaceus JB14]|uniref:Csf1 N-terminal domain-containing protein n=1 Tax=Gymnopus androsaceus JB14 TaxID=1447944 RepID=A0A6A4ILB6_9AGAR|nr:hypothetical protein BT96DRAFT_961320 [Gymnopus androsaceus JB14]
MLNIVLLIVCICITIASFIYFFYFNRFIAWFLGLAIRLVYWNDGASSIWLEIGSIHFSILSGRILLKDIRYHSSSQTAKIVKAQLAWRYWIRRPTNEEEIGLSLGGDDGFFFRDASCRIQVSIHGFEWFLYNRTAAYDNILSQMRAQPSAYSERRASLQKAPSGMNTPVPAASLLTSSLRSRAPAFLLNLVARIREQLPNLDPKDLLPLGIHVSKGAIICGNSSTPNLLVAEFKRMEGTFGIVPSRSKYDLYKQMLTLRFTQALVQYVENEHYRDSMTATGEVIEEQINNYEFKTPFTRASYHTFSKIWDSLKLYAPVLKYLSAQQTHASRQASHHRRRAKKSLDEDTPVGVDFSKLEYATERKILETPLLELCYYVDVVGQVPQSPIKEAAQFDPFDIGNGDVGPEWGVDIVLHSGFLRYGPWADRQRGELQRTFFPPMYNDSEETPRLKPGDQRAWTAMRVFVELRDETTLHIPLRESSKNWQWDGLTQGIDRPRKREPALLHLTAGDRSSISYLMPMVASQRGYEPILEVHLDTVAVTSSLNDIRLVSAESCRIHCELPSPLKWNVQRTWNVSVTLRRPTLYLIRDHINMFTDLGKDWASGPPHDYHRFIPMIYQFELDMHHYELKLYANDHNIIDKPLVEEENAIFAFAGSRMKFNTTIPSNVYRPESTTIPFSIDIPDVSLRLSLPRWNTNALHAPKDGNTLAKVGSFRLNGSYMYFAEVHEDHIEQLELTMKVRNILFKSLGWSIRYFMILRENYLGSFTHFSTLYEYLDKRKRGVPLGDPVLQKFRPGTSNVMQVEMGIMLVDGLMVYPEGLPGYEIGLDIPGAPQNSIGHCLVLTMPTLDLRFRMHDLYMEMTLNIGSISGSIEEHFPETLVYPDFKVKKSRDIFVIDGIDITANRLFGPVPRTITYVCLWEIHLGSIKASLSASQAAVLRAAAQAFQINFTDPLNAPANDYQTGVYPDLTFMKVSLGSVNVLWKAGSAALDLSIPQGLKIDHNDLGGQYHKSMTSIRLPQLSLKALLDYNKSNTWLEGAEVVTDIFLDIYSSPAGWREMSAAQADFVREQDLPTGRVERFIQMLKTARSMPGTRTHLNGLYMPQPTLLHRKAYSRHHHEHRRNDIPPVDVPQSSESEGESQDRFAHPMRSARPIPDPLSVNEKNEEESASFGDESDNEDLTDHSDSEWSDLGESFCVYEEPRKRNAAVPGRTSIALASPDNSKNTVVYRLSQRSGLEVKITPVLINVVEALQSDLEAGVSISDNRPLLFFNIYFMSTELQRGISGRIDGCRLTSVIFRILRSARLPVITVLDIFLESVTLHILQRLDVSQNIRSREQQRRIFLSGMLHLTCTNVRQPFRRRPFSSKESALSFSATNLRAALSRDNSELSCDNFTTEVSHSFPSLLVSTVSAIESYLPRLVRIQQKMKASSSNVVQSTIYHILSSSNNDLVIDPLSTIQPSFLVQIGLPQELRADLAFRFLFHLRNCLWHLRKGNSSWGMKLDETVAIADLIPRLENTLLVLDPDVYHVSGLGPLEPLIPNLKSSTSTWQTDATNYSFNYVSVRLDLVHLKIIDPEHRPPCQMSFADMVFGVRRPSPSKRSLYPVAFGDIQITVYSYLMTFIQESLRAQKLAPSPAKKDKKARFNHFKVVNVHAVVALKQLRLRAVAEKLTFEFGISGMRHSSTILVHQHAQKQLMNHSLLFSDVFVKARATPSMAQPNEHDDLASLMIVDGMVSSVMRNENLEQNIKVAFTIKCSTALRLYRFIEEWRADFLPGIEATIQALMSEIQKPPGKPSGKPSRNLVLQVDGRLSCTGIYLRVMHDTWLSWEVNDTAVYLKSLEKARQTSYDFGVQLSSQTFAVTTDSSEPSLKTRVKLGFPPFLLSGHLDQTSIRIISLIHFLEMKQKFGQDFNDLLAVIQQTRSKPVNTTAPSSAAPPSLTSTQRLEFSVFAKMQGFRVGFEGRASVLYLECPGISGKFEGVPEKAWSVTVTDLALSLAPRSSMIPQSSGFNRHQRSAFVIIDFKVLSKSQGSKSEVLQVAVTKIHAVMQPSSIAEIGDFIDELQMEMTDRREQRAHELAAFKQKTQRIIKTFEIKSEELTPSQRMSWLKRYIIEFSLSNIGVAFPLAHDHDMDLPPVGSHDSTAVRAFLFSIQSVKFGTQYGETGQASMERLSFQFVSCFRQSVPADFSGDNHDTRNRLLYPTMKAHLRSSKSSTSNQMYMTATVSGFILDIDSTIPDYVFSLFDVYRHGKERVQRLSANLPRGGPTPAEIAPVQSKQKSHSGHSATAPDIFVSLTFLSGKVSMYSIDASKSSRVRAYSGTWDRPDQPIGDVGAEVFNLPVVSVWAEYRAVPPSRNPSEAEAEPSILMFKSTVHSSTNTLRPMLLPFITEVVTLVEERLRTSSRVEPRSPVSAEPTVQPELPSVPPSSTLRISFSLRIDQSRLELTCLPDVNVVAALNWDSGGFMINVLPGARDVTFTGTVGGLTIGLKHGFLSEDCLRLDARNLAFSVTLGKRYIEDGPILTSISLVLDTEFLGGVRFSRLQDLLCFKAVWLDRIPVFNGHNSAVIEDNPSKPNSMTVNNPKPEFTTAILIRIRQIKLDIDLGQSISSVLLHLENCAFRSKFTQSSNELSFRVGHVGITAKGNVAGYADISNCVFQTIRWVGNPSTESDIRDRMLELRMTSGPLVVMLESDYQKLLHYRAEPLEVEILDDWSIPKASQTDRPLRLSFTVKSPEVVADRDCWNYPKASSHMSLRLDLLRIVVFPRTMGDAEVAQFVGQDVRGRLNRLVESESTSSKRDIRLSFSSMKISRFAQLGHAVMHPSTEVSDGRQWLQDLLKDASSADIVGLPSMTMHMTSEEFHQGMQKTLAYTFDSQFVRLKGVQHSDDIYITLNVGLYSWLTVLRKTLAREMEQVQTAADWRTFAASPVQGSRKKAPEPLNLVDAPRSATIPHFSSNQFSPFSPKSASAVNSTFGSPDASFAKFQQLTSPDVNAPSPTETEAKTLVYQPGHRHIERLTMRQLGEATPGSGFSLEDSLPQYVHEYATAPLEEIMEILLKLYSRQLLAARTT